MSLEQRLDLCQVALRGRATKLASNIVLMAGGGEADQSQCEQRHNSAARHCRAPETAEKRTHLVFLANSSQVYPALLIARS
jgi:hypothetical protein